MKQNKTGMNQGKGVLLGLLLLFALCLVLPGMAARAVESSRGYNEPAAKSTTVPEGNTTQPPSETTEAPKEGGTDPSTEAPSEPSTEAPTEPVPGPPFQVLFQPFAYENITRDQNLVIITENVVNVRKNAGMDQSVIAWAYQGQVLKQTGVKTDRDGVLWYKVVAVGEKRQANGYISSTVSRSVSLSAQGDVYANYLKLLGFPDSYIPKLKALHQAYPNWIFRATDTGLDWAASVFEEANPAYYPGISLIHSDIWPNSFKSLENDNFDWAANAFKTIYDGPGWTLASEKLVAYFMDPRNFLQEDGIFQFLNLLFDANQTVEGVKAIVRGTFMEDGKHIYKEHFSYPELLFRVGCNLGISPYYLAASIKQEIGADGLSKSISGKSTTVSPGGVPLKGYYNYYNVYAYTMMDMDANDVGLWFAEGQDNGLTSFNRPWNTREKAIWGGAMFHAYNYLLMGQNTLYYKRFNVNSEGNLYRHQYMTNIMGAYSESRHLSLAYDALARQNVLRFDIPVYLNMPSEPAPQPVWGSADTRSPLPPYPSGDAGARENLNPNNRLLSMKGAEAVKNPKVNVKDTEYVMAVKSDSLNLSAVAIDEGATVSGTGILPLDPGENLIELLVTAANGDTRQYTLNVFRASEESAVFTADYPHGEGHWRGLEPGTLVKDLRTGVQLTEGSTLKVLDASGKRKSEKAPLCTGDRIRIYAPNGALYYLGTCVLYGDINGDGEIDIFDLVALRNHLIRLPGESLKGNALLAADVEHDGELDIFDLVGIRNHLIHISEIDQKGE